MADASPGADLDDSLDRAGRTAGPLGRAVLRAVRALGLGAGALPGAEGLSGSAGAEEDGVARAEELPPPPFSRTKWTCRVPHPVLIGHAASLSQVALSAEVDAVLAKYNLLCLPAPPPTFDL